MQRSCVERCGRSWRGGTISILRMEWFLSLLTAEKIPKVAGTLLIHPGFLRPFLYPNVELFCWCCPFWLRIFYHTPPKAHSSTSSVTEAHSCSSFLNQCSVWMISECRYSDMLKFSLLTFGLCAFQGNFRIRANQVAEHTWLALQE